MKKKIILFNILLMGALFLGMINANAKDVMTYDELKNCLEQESVCTLEKSIENNLESIELTTTRDVTLDLNGNNIINYNFIVSSGNLTLNDSKGGGTINTTANYGIYVSEAGITINGGKIKSNSSAIYFDKSNAIINSGEFVGKVYVTRASNVVINGGIFRGLSTMEALYGSSSTLIINDGDFIGEYGLKYSGCGHLEIKGGNFEGKADGIWLSNSYTCLNSENYSLISGGNFKGKWGARIEGNNTNVLAGGTFTGTQIGLKIECANPIHENCKNAVLLKGGKYITSNTESSWPYVSAAIFMNSDPDNPIKISDLLDDGYELSNKTLLEEDGGVYGYYSYTESQNVSIDNPNSNDFNNPNDKSETVSKSEVENPKTSDINLIIIGMVTLIVLTGVIVGVRRLKKLSK